VIAAAILAAGASRRMGRPKQLAIVGGEPLVLIAARAAKASQCSEVAVVLGAMAGAVAPVLAGAGVALLANAEWEEGMASSLRRAAAWARTRDAEALVVCVCDQPLLTGAHIDALIATHRAHGGRTVASRYAEITGAPAIFGAAAFDQLATIAGDQGARAVLRATDTVAVDWPDGALDIDDDPTLRLAQLRRPFASS
jgi:xanthine dehydrogenase accessory factor